MQNKAASVLLVARVTSQRHGQPAAFHERLELEQDSRNLEVGNDANITRNDRCRDHLTANADPALLCGILCQAVH